MNTVANDAAKLWVQSQEFRSKGAIPAFPLRNMIAAIASAENNPEGLKAFAYGLYRDMEAALEKAA